MRSVPSKEQERESVVEFTTLASRECAETWQRNSKIIVRTETHGAQIFTSSARVFTTPFRICGLLERKQIYCGLLERKQIYRC